MATIEMGIAILMIKVVPRFLTMALSSTRGKNRTSTILVSSNGFGSVRGRVFDTGRMSTAELQQLGLVGEDSRVSDHLMLVVDCNL